MLVDRFFDELASRLEDIRRDESNGIDASAELCAGCLERGGVIHIYDTGHLVSNELVKRAGGLAAYTPFSFSLNVISDNSFRGAQGAGSDAEREMALAAAALDKSCIRKCDVLIIGSVSGNSAPVVELAMESRRRGVRVIAVTGMAQSGNLKPLHPSGKRLSDAADIVLDNHTVYGDAMIHVEGLPFPICPFSGIGTVVLLWAVTASLIEKLLARGIEPTVFQSVHFPGGFEQMDASSERYTEKGY